MTERTILQERIAQRLKELRRSARGVSVKAGLGPDAIRTILDGRSRSPRADTLAALADELQCEVGYLLGHQDRPYSSDELNRSATGIVKGIGKLPIMFRLSQEWKHAPDKGADETFFNQELDRLAQSDYYSLPGYLPGPQRLEFIEDDHVSPVAPKGAYLHTLSLSGLGQADLQDGDLVIVTRMALRSDGSAITQRSCRRFRLIGEKAALLEPVGAEQLEPPLRLEGASWKAAAGDLAVQGGESVLVEALVLRAITVLAGPDLFTGLEDHQGPEAHSKQD